MENRIEPDGGWESEAEEACFNELLEWTDAHITQPKGEAYVTAVIRAVDQMMDVVSAARDEGIDPEYVVALFNKTLAQVRAYEAGRTGDQDR